MNLDEVVNLMKSLDNWTLESNMIVREFEFENFVKAIEFVNKVKDVAEKNEHHPDIIIRYNKVLLTLTTHFAHGLTEKDCEVAKEIDRITLKEA